MTEWVTPIFDRTEDDVIYAKEQIAALLSSDTVYEIPELKGCFNVSDINRIEGNIAYLSEKCDNFDTPLNLYTRTWKIENIPDGPSVQRIIYNIHLLVGVFGAIDDMPSIPETISDYNDLNTIEEVIYKLKIMFDSMDTSMQKSGMFQSGAKRILPLRSV